MHFFVMKLIALAIAMLFIPFPLAYNEFSIENMVKEINDDLLLYYWQGVMQFAPRYTGTENCSKAEEWAYNEFKVMGLNVTYFEWEMAGFKDKNVVATLPGDEYIIIVSAHIDTVEDAPGAIDDASGVAGVMAMAKVFSRYSFKHTVRFVLFSGEEVGTYGSYNYARYVYGKGEKILAVFNLDMIGFADTAKGGKYIRFFTPERANWLVDFSMDIAKKYYDLLEMNVERVPNYPGADHQAFIYYGYDALFIAQYDGYPYGHTENDTLDKVNITYETKATRFVSACVAELANKDVKTYVQIKKPKEGYIYIFNRQIMPIVSKNWYSGMRGLTVVIGRVDILAEVDGNVEKVIFAVDDRMWKWDYNEPYEWKLNVFLFGKHYVRVYAYGEEVAKDEMDIWAIVPYIP